MDMLEPLIMAARQYRGWAQGLTLVHLLAQRKRILWERGCIKGYFNWVFSRYDGVLWCI